MLIYVCKKGKLFLVQFNIAADRTVLLSIWEF